ncbi:hypothetical protein [Porphyromonas endodontalis]|uniref:hypothetical protein n=1 Tax=Porphyromonas endodontalis TaxID=28124 RepID=UPI003C75D3FF
MIRNTERILSTPKTKYSYREIPISKQLFEALSIVKKIPFSLRSRVHLSMP